MKEKASAVEMTEKAGKFVATGGESCQKGISD